MSIINEIEKLRSSSTLEDIGNLALKFVSAKNNFDNHYMNSNLYDDLLKITESAWNDLDVAVKIYNISNPIYVAGKPEFVGKMPIRQDITILPADDPKREIGFVCKEYLGGEVYSLDKDGKMIKKDLISYDDLQVGMEVAVPTLFGHYKMTIHKDEYDQLYAGDSNSHATLAFNKDDRHCWISTCLINLKSIRKLNKHFEIN